jgi:hypothetical protein
LIVFFLQFFVIDESLKVHWKVSKGRLHMQTANVIATQDFEDRKNHSLLATRSSNR